MEVLTILAKDLDKVAVIGGWVPELAFPDKGHIGSLDVDLALDAKKLKPLAYESICRKLLAAGYQQSADLPSRFFRSIKGTSIQIKVDLITGEFPDLAPQGTHLQVQEMAVCKFRGVDLAFAFQQEVPVEGVLPDGSRNTVTVRLPTISAYLCIKAITLSERMKHKDAYDIYFSIDNYPGGYKALAAEFRPILDHRLIAEGIAILRDKFSRLDSIGPVWAAQAAQAGTMGAGFDLDMEQRRAYEVVNALLREIEGMMQPA
jgi:hypothetical protein